MIGLIRISLIFSCKEKCKGNGETGNKENFHIVPFSILDRFSNAMVNLNYGKN